MSRPTSGSLEELQSQLSIALIKSLMLRVEINNASMAVTWNPQGTSNIRWIEEMLVWRRKLSAEGQFRELRTYVSDYVSELKPRLSEANKYLTYLGLERVVAAGDFGLSQCSLNRSMGGEDRVHGLEQGYLRLLDCLDAIDNECELAIQRLAGRKGGDHDGEMMPA